MAIVSQGNSVVLDVDATGAIWVKSTGNAEVTVNRGGTPEVSNVTTDVGRFGYYGEPFQLTIRSGTGQAEYQDQQFEFEPLTSKQAGDNSDSSPLDVSLAVNNLQSGAVGFDAITLKGLPQTDGAPAGFGDLATNLAPAAVAAQSQFKLDQGQPAQITNPVTKYGRVVANFMPNQWTATIGSPTLTQGYAGYDANGNVTGIKSRTGQQGMLLVEPTVNTTTRLQLGTPATNILTPSTNGRLGLWVYIESAAANGDVNINIDIELSTQAAASGTTNGLFVGFAPNCMREGWNFLTVRMRDFRAYQVGQNVTEDHPAGVNMISYGNGADANIIANPLTFIRINIAGSTATGSKIYLDSLWTDFSSKPQAVLGCDGGINDVEIALPIFQQYGWIGYTAFPYRVWTSGSKIISDLNSNLSPGGLAMYTAGWDFTNHTANHLRNGELTSPAEIDYELTVAQAWQNALGFVRGAEFYVSPQSSTSRLSERVISNLGYKLQRNVKHRNNHVTPFGIDNPNSIGSYDIGSASQVAFQAVTNNTNTAVNGWQQFSKIKRAIDVAIAYGYADFPFWHGITTVGDDGTGEGLTGDSLLIYASAFTQMCEYIREKELAGEIEVCRGISGFYYGVSK